jgi:hypothetical protein
VIDCKNVPLIAGRVELKRSAGLQEVVQFGEETFFPLTKS